MVEYSVIPEDAWNQLTTEQEKKSDAWDGLLNDLTAGKIVSLPYTDAKDRRAKRLGIARRATTRGFKTEARYTDSHMAVRRSDLVSPSPAEQAPAERPRRSRETKADTPRAAEAQPL